MGTFNLMYYSDFVSVSGRHWRIEISGSGTADMGPVPLPADRPLVLEWQETEHYEPLQASSATLRVISESDRRFLDTLYSEIPCEVRLDVLLDGKLYWRGTLDTEFYEEPYSYRDGYEVSLTFSDLAVLDRLDFDLDGRVTALELLNTALDRAALSEVPVTQISTLLPGTHSSEKPDASSYLALDDIKVDSSNFYDEDGKPSSWRDVLAAVLQPMSFRLVQRGGRFYVYDLCALRGSTPAAVEWDGTDAVLSRDRVYNRVVITVSPYGSAEVLRDCITAEDPSGLDPMEHNALTIYTSFYDVSNNSWQFGSTEGLTKGFYLYLGGDTGGDGVTLGSECRYFLLSPVNDGDDGLGVLAMLRHGAMSVREPRQDGLSGLARYGYAAGYPQCHDLFHVDHSELLHPFPDGMAYAPDSEVFTTDRIRVIQSGKFRLKVTLELLFDVRYNPYEDADTDFTAPNGTELDNESEAWSDFQESCRLGYVPVKLHFYGLDGSLIGFYSNVGVYSRYFHASDASYGQMPPEMRRRNSGWKHIGETSDIDIAYLAYYDVDGNQTADSCCFGGWKSNRPMVWSDGMALPEWYSKNDSGEIMDNPADVFGQDGYIELTVMQGIVQMHDDNTIHPRVYDDVRWLAYRNPEISVIERDTSKNASEEDFELTAYLNGSVREEVSLDLIVGSYGDLPNCRGLMYDKDGNRIKTFIRNGISGRPEILLAGTIYSQYASAKLRLSGTMVLLDGFGTYSDAAMPGRSFIMASDVQDVRCEESKAVLTELGTDDYSDMEIEEAAS